MDRFGRVVLPKGIRRSLRAPRTALLEAEAVGNRLELTLAEVPTRLRRKGNLLVLPKQGVAADAVKAVQETRADRL